jgi:hypothetical protein
MQSFTAMSEEGVSAVLDAAMGLGSGGYAMVLKGQDLQLMIRALQAAYEHTADGGCPSLEDGDVASYNMVTVDEWAADFLSGMAETLGIEFV